jgi:ankyrin repeat protein
MVTRHLCGRLALGYDRKRVVVSDRRPFGAIDSSAIDPQNGSETSNRLSDLATPQDAMNQLQQASIELRLDDLKNMIRHDGDLPGTLLAACSAHDPDPTIQVLVIRYLLQRGVAINETDKNGVTPLHRAVRFRSPAAVKELIAHGADINVVDKKTKSTPLHRAVTNTGAPETSGKMDCAIEITKLLLANGADPRIKNKNGKAPIDYVKNPAMKDVFCKHVAT